MSGKVLMAAIGDINDRYVMEFLSFEFLFHSA